MDDSRPKSVKSTKSSKPMKVDGNYKDGHQRILFDNGVYEGQIKNNRRSGQGRYSWNDGNCYDGEWNDDQKHGKGKFTWSNGDEYEGQYEDDQRSGYGVKKYANGDIYKVSAGNYREAGKTAANKAKES